MNTPDQPNPAPSGPVQQWRPLLKGERAEKGDKVAVLLGGIREPSEWDWPHTEGAHQSHWRTTRPIHEAAIAVTPPDPTPPQPAPFVRALEGNYQPCDYPEDAAGENGNYATKCQCGTEFIGHKRRFLCKVCAEKTATATNRHEASRAVFERSFAPRNHLRNMHGTYIDRETYFQWQAWCRALDHAAQEQPQRNPVLGPECPKCGTIPLNLPPEAEEKIRALFPEFERPAPEPPAPGSAREWVEAHILTIHTGIVSIRYMTEKDARELADRADAAEAQVKNYARSIIISSEQLDKAEAQLAAAQARITALNLENNTMASLLMDETRELAAARAELAALRAEQGTPQWLPIESAPRDEQDEFLLYSIRSMVVGYYADGDWRDTNEGFPILEQPTHWMPLPAPPQDLMEGGE